MNSFTDIGQFRGIVKAVTENHDFSGMDNNGSAIFNHSSPYPTLSFRGTVKLHGTNAGVVLYKDGHIDLQSREREISPTSDNAGFALYMRSPDVFINLKSLFNDIPFNDNIAIFGEWCGKGIQKGIAISQLPKMFVIFAVKIDGVYQDMAKYAHLKIEQHRIFNIMQFPTFNIDIDFEKPEEAQNKLVELTMNVEQQCPVGQYFGVQGVGEGIVWEYINNNTRYIFKIKGEKHQSSKIKTLVTVDVEAIENIKAFVEYAVTESRLLQGIDKLREKGISIDVKSTGDYLRWIVGDIIKEESDTIVKNQIDPKKMNGFISQKAKQFWMNYLNKEVDL